MIYITVTRKIINSNVLVKLFVSLNIKSFYNLLFFFDVNLLTLTHIRFHPPYIAFLYEIMKQNEIDATEATFLLRYQLHFTRFFFYRYYIRTVEAERRTSSIRADIPLSARAKDIQWSQNPGKVMKRYFFATGPPETLFVNVGPPR